MRDTPFDRACIRFDDDPALVGDCHTETNDDSHEHKAPQQVRHLYAVVAPLVSDDWDAKDVTPTMIRAAFYRRFSDLAAMPDDALMQMVSPVGSVLVQGKAESDA